MHRQWNLLETHESLMQIANGRHLGLEVLEADSERLPLEVQQVA
jgi:hypothetical protein